MSDAVNRALAEREALDTGFPASVVFSVLVHGLLVVAALGGRFLFPPPPPLQVQDGFVIALPRGGGGTPAAAAPAPAPPAAQPEPPAPEPPAPAPAPKILKPPKEAPRRATLPELDARASKKRPTPSPPPVRSGTAAGGVTGARGAVPGGTGTSSATPGLEFGPPGPGVPGGTDMFGDWYLAGVQRKIWLLWTQQIHADFRGQIRVTFTILADGSVEDVRVTEASPVAMLNLAAQRAVLSAAPFGPLPKIYGTNRFTINAVFKPNP